MTGSISRTSCALLLLASIGSHGADNAMVANRLGADELGKIELELHKHTAVLSSDEFGGRAPASTLR